MMPETGWFPVALADDVEPGTSVGTRLFGQELVAWRDDAGAAHVWQDRCPHRGMRLSFGFVRGNHIACLYHGWRFDAAGRCRYIPAHPQLDVPATITVERFGCAERLGLLWVRLGSDEGAVPPGIEAATLPVRSIALPAGADAVVAALRAAPPFAESGRGAVIENGPLVTIEAGGRRLHAAVQPATDTEAMLHLTVEPGAGVDRQRLSLWAEALRRSLEAEGSHHGAAA